VAEPVMSDVAMLEVATVGRFPGTDPHPRVEIVVLVPVMDAVFEREPFENRMRSI
jgi:hypothetical protein